jgi:hypothetical protein
MATIQEIKKVIGDVLAEVKKKKEKAIARLEEAERVCRKFCPCERLGSSSALV